VLSTSYIKMKSQANIPVSQFRATVVLLIFLLCFLFGAWPQGNYAIQANIIYRFTKYINWPEDKKSGEFVIGVVGNTPLYDELTNYTINKSVGGRPIVIKKLSASASRYSCQILFISDEESSSIKRIVSSTTGAATLLVSETEGVAHKGSCINFTIVDDRLKLEINKVAIEKRNLDIATELLNLGTVVK
jgi:hypothetical protein